MLQFSTDKQWFQEVVPRRWAKPVLVQFDLKHEDSVAVALQDALEYGEVACSAGKFQTDRHQRDHYRDFV
eukprot:9775072-Lingulodinium_polyedra.AAC.1